MFKKKTALNVRPPPPSFAEMTDDINSADSNDIIFTQINNGTMVTCSQCYYRLRFVPGQHIKAPRIRRPTASGVGIGEGVFPP